MHVDHRFQKGLILRARELRHGVGVCPSIEGLTYSPTTPDAHSVHSFLADCESLYLASLFFLKYRFWVWFFFGYTKSTDKGSNCDRKILCYNVVFAFNIWQGLQGWPADDLPFLITKNYTSNISSDPGNNGTSTTVESSMELDTGLIAFGFSFAVISLLILVQVCPFSSVVN